ncbi:hypothetical protein GQ600_20928 [Phytophthora cactorum]|nr:hypothetical protein GQ600_20928 [Phytophthora cactorum]
MLTINGFTCAKPAIRTTLPVTRQRTVTKNKNHHTKLSFLCAAAARPQLEEQGCAVFDGKMGRWPVVDTWFALRNSKNRPKTPQLR